MNTKKIFKIMLDATMLVLYILLMFGYKISPVFHEVVGIGIGGLFILHIALNAKETRGLAKVVFRGNAPRRAKLNFFADMTLALSMLVTIVSGILISGVVFSFSINPVILGIHNFCAYVALVIMATHTALHLKYVVNVIRNAARNGHSGFGKALRRYSAVAAIAVTAYVFSASAFNGTSVADATNSGSSGSSSDNASSSSTSTTASSSPSSSESVSSDSTSASSDSSQVSSSSSDDSTPTLDEYLSNLFCTGCGRHCSLLTPACGKGVAQAAAAQVDYNEEYSS